TTSRTVADRRDAESTQREPRTQRPSARRIAFCYAGERMASYLDSVPFSGIIRIRDMMYSVKNPFRLDQGDVTFDAPDSVKSAMTRAIAENRTHYVQTT